MGQLIQVLIAIAIGVAILYAGLWGVRLLAQPGPEAPDPDSVTEVERGFHCAVCGMRLTVTHAQGEELKAPRHCREEMDEVPA